MKAPVIALLWFTTYTVIAFGPAIEDCLKLIQTNHLESVCKYRFGLNLNIGSGDKVTAPNEPVETRNVPITIRQYSDDTIQSACKMLMVKGSDENEQATG